MSSRQSLYNHLDGQSIMDTKALRAFALANAVKYEGRANQGAVIGQAIGADETLKKDMKALAKAVAAVIKDISGMTLEAQIAELQRIAPELLAPKPKEEKPRELPTLEGAEEGKVVTRFPPEPSKHLHIGHAVTALINFLEAKRYGGTFVLRFDDTNPDKCTNAYVDAIREDLHWLGAMPGKEIFASDHMQAYYDACVKLLKASEAYVCFCKQDVMRDLRFKGIACACKDVPVKEHVRHWQRMLDGQAAPGECIVRFVGDMQHPNGTLRDPVIMRIVTAAHYRHGTKYRVWPVYDFQSPIAEGFGGVTHILRSAEFDQRIELQELIKRKLGLPSQDVLQFGRVNVVGALTKGREIREKIENGEYVGWDDPRLVTLKALRRRGITPAALHELVFALGFEKGQSNVDWTIIAAMNRKLIDAESKRRFFVADPVHITIANAPAQSVEIYNHPEHPELGVRELAASKDFVITSEDASNLKDGNLYRLMECVNFRKQGSSYVFDSLDHETYKKQGRGIIHWLPAGGHVPAKVLMPDATTISGVVEKSAASLPAGTILQFERFGFVRLDRIENGIAHFWFAHK